MRLFYFLVFLFAASTAFGEVVQNEKKKEDERISVAQKYFDKGDYNRAVLILEKKLSEAQKNTSTIEIVRTYMDVAEFYRFQMVYEKSEELLKEAKKYVDKLKSNSELAIRYYIKSSVVQHGIKNYEAMKSDLLIALKKVKANGDLSLEIEVINNLAIAERRLGNYENSLGYYTEGLKIIVDKNDTLSQIPLLINLAVLNLSLERIEVSENYMRQAHDLVNSFHFTGNEAVSLGREFLMIYVKSNLAEILLKSGRYDEAKKQLDICLILLETEKSIQLEFYVVKEFIDYFEAVSDFEQLSEYLIKKSELQQTLFSQDREKAIIKSKLNYVIAEKDKDIKRVQKENRILSLNSILYFSIYLVSILFLVLVIVLMIYLFTQKQKRRKIKDELMQVKLREEEREREVIKEKTEFELDYNQKKLALSTMHLLGKNDILSKTKELLEPHLEEITLFKPLMREIDNCLRLDQDWDEFKYHFQEVHSGFFDELIRKHDGLTNDDLRLCAYLRVNLTSKEIAQITHVIPMTINKRRNRLRKKLDIGAGDNLHAYLSQM